MYSRIIAKQERLDPVLAKSWQIQPTLNGITDAIITASSYCYQLSATNT